MSLAPAICLDEPQSLAAVVACPNKDYRQRILQTLHSAHWLAEEAQGGAEALAKLDATPCHALLVDRSLPDLEVGELLEIVKSRHPDVDIFLMDSETGQAPLLQGTPRHTRARELFRVSGNQPGWPPRRQPGKIDQRNFHRYGVNFPCTVRRVRKRKAPKAHVEPAVQTATKDVSTGGLYFETSADWKVGTDIECMLHLPTKVFRRHPVAIRCRGKIARVTQKAPGSIGVGATIEQFEFPHLEKMTPAGSAHSRSLFRA